MITRAAAGALLGAILASAALVLSTRLDPSVRLDFDSDLPRQLTSGFHPVERGPAETFVWTTQQASVNLRGLDRDTAWQCVVRLRAARPAAAPPADVALGIDGLTVRRHRPGDAWEEIAVDAPARPGVSGLSLTVGTTPTFVPGASDARALGVQLDRIDCAPSGSGGVMPPRRALVAAASAGGALGAVFALLAPMLAAALAGSVLFAATTGFLLTAGVAACAPAYLDRAVAVSLWSAGPVVAFAAIRASTGRTLHPATGFVLAFSSAMVCLKLLALLHPSKEAVDAVFHAHRLGAVLGGNYYFTQPMPGGVRFPYAIGLYLTATPLAGLVTDHVALLRIVVVVAEAAAAASLYAALVRGAGDRLAGGLAVAAYHVAPLPYVVIGNANLTYAFGQSVAVIAGALAVALPFDRRRAAAAAALFAVTALAFLSHVGIFPVLAVMLVATGALYWFAGAGLRARGSIVAGVSVLAAVFAIGIYYAHFPEVYSSFVERVTSTGETPAAAAPGASVNPSAQPALTIGARVERAAALGLRGLGWPLLALAAAGVWLVVRRPRNRLTPALAGWGASFVVFLAFRVIAPVDAPYQRYADEFIDRVYYATLPAFAILAAFAVARGWQAGAGWRIAAGVLAAASAVIGVRAWIAWIA